MVWVINVDGGRIWGSANHQDFPGLLLANLMQHCKMLLFAHFTGCLQGAHIRCVIPSTTPTTFIFDPLCNLGGGQCLQFGAKIKVVLTGVTLWTVRFWLNLPFNGRCPMTWFQMSSIPLPVVCVVIHSGRISLAFPAFLTLFGLVLKHVSCPTGYALGLRLHLEPGREIWQGICLVSFSSQYPTTEAVLNKPISVACWELNSVTYQHESHIAVRSRFHIPVIEAYLLKPAHPEQNCRRLLGPPPGFGESSG